MSEFKYIQFMLAEGIARITLSRPKHNVLNIEMMKELSLKIEELACDQDLKALVILGEGRSWCAGVDVAEHKPEMVDVMMRAFNRIFELLDTLKVPTIAAVHGAALGGGMELAIGCDIIIAATSATFGQPEIKLGFFPPYAAVRLPQLVGPAKALEICVTGKTYTAAQACSMGLVSSVVEDEAFKEELEKLIGEIKTSSPLIIRLNKQAIKAHLGMDFNEALQGVTDLFLNTLMKTEDTLEGIASFYEKRKPRWKNR
ncbi:MAG: enoyl-CoA hydratase/isomerase family protein [Deltaproteobacteria bacterium]|nr:enoyl-CoA hydratase/isomerase family protein [Deltaproteobacteria bacterium]MBW2151181.1 enoyl-CoA hydratase/isomerase family protein [Deltaproteobacteria bacterium]